MVIFIIKNNLLFRLLGIQAVHLPDPIGLGQNGPDRQRKRPERAAKAQLQQLFLDLHQHTRKGAEMGHPPHCQN